MAAGQLRPVPYFNPKPNPITYKSVKSIIVLRYFLVINLVPNDLPKTYENEQWKQLLNE